MLRYPCSKPSKPTCKRLSITFAVLMVLRNRTESNLVNCNNVHDLVTTLNIDHNREEWKLFTDSSKLNLKAVLLHYGKVLPSVTVWHAINKNESHDNMEPSELHELREIPKAAYWRIGSCCYMSRIAAELHEVLLFIMWIGQLSKYSSLQAEGMAFPTINGNGNKECIAPTAGRIEHFAASSAHQTGTDKQLR